MELKKYGWLKDKSFERYYYNQLNRFKNATLLISDDELSENSSLEEISARFDELITFLEVVKANKDIISSITYRLASDSRKYSTEFDVDIVK